MTAIAGLENDAPENDRRKREFDGRQENDGEKIKYGSEGLKFAELENDGPVYARSLVIFLGLSEFSKANKIEQYCTV